MNERDAAPVVHVVDDDPQVAKALARLLREHGFRTAVSDSAEAFLAQCDASQIGCVVLDVHLPGLDGLALQRRLSEGGSSWPIVFLTGHGDIPMSVHAMKAGAVDFLTKPVAADVLVAAVRAGVAQDARNRESRTESAALRNRMASLTAREREVLAGLSAGRLNKQIAADLGITEPTVKFHRARIMERMQAQTIAELMHLVARFEFAHGARTAAPSGRVPHDGPA
ncbi:MAG: response regulator [Burkholderiaceae bacterium]|jgi:FixJ family two-component response regulator|nr:response regulator transcription factor [Burkholderiales bacterium]MCZ8097490.1 response regulator [Burkholderiales bacterium]MCZ8336643.1 response regulator [Burkholderiaceae bacterium]